MTKIDAIRQTANPYSITRQDLWEAADEIVSELDGDAPTPEAIADVLAMHPRHPAITLELCGMLLDMQSAVDA
jgi:hypothetical protein